MTLPLFLLRLLRSSLTATGEKKTRKTEMAEKTLKGHANCGFHNVFTCSHPQFGSGF